MHESSSQQSKSTPGERVSREEWREERRGSRCGIQQRTTKTGPPLQREAPSQDFVTLKQDIMKSTGSGHGSRFPSPVNSFLPIPPLGFSALTFAVLRVFFQLHPRTVPSLRSSSTSSIFLGSRRCLRGRCTRLLKLVVTDPGKDGAERQVHNSASERRGGVSQGIRRRLGGGGDSAAVFCWKWCPKSPSAAPRGVPIPNGLEWGVLFPRQRFSPRNSIRCYVTFISPFGYMRDYIALVAQSRNLTACTLLSGCREILTKLQSVQRSHSEVGIHLHMSEVALIS